MPPKRSSSRQSGRIDKKDLPPSEYRQMTVQQLKEELAARQLQKSGTKEELVQRLELNDSASDYFQWKAAALHDELVRRNLPSTGTKSTLIDRLISDDRGIAPQKDESPSRRKSLRVKRVVEPEPELSLLTSPISTVKMFVLALLRLLSDLIAYCIKHSGTVTLLMALSAVIGVLNIIETPYTPQFKTAQNVVVWYAWWVVLGIASSIGLGTGLHTFVLFLGPLIAKTTIIAGECGNLDFALTGKNAFICRSGEQLSSIPLWLIYSKIMLEAFAWGAGTAIGELPPYFVARGAALAGREDDEIDHIEEIKSKLPKDRTMFEAIEVYMFDLMQRMGFVGILLCASIPNPLFDLAGITCGHFLIPFSTFFGATFIGKALIKAALQSITIILMFSKESITAILEVLNKNSPQLHDQVQKFLKQQTLKYTSTEVQPDEEESTLSLAWNTFIFLMIAYFLLSIVQSMARSELKQQQQQRLK